MRVIRRFIADESGATAIEYGLIAALISLAIVAGVGKAGNSLSALYGSNNNRIDAAFN